MEKEQMSRDQKVALQLIERVMKEHGVQAVLDMTKEKENFPAIKLSKKEMEILKAGFSILGISVGGSFSPPSISVTVLGNIKITFNPF